MARKIAPCGTVTAYNRHRRHKEDPCDECKSAKRESQQEKRQQEKSQSAETVTGVVVDQPVDRLADAEANLRTVIQVMDSGMSLPQTAQLSKRRQELQEYIAELKAEAEKPSEVSVIDELTKRRRERGAKAAG